MGKAWQRAREALAEKAAGTQSSPSDLQQQQQNKNQKTVGASSYQDIISGCHRHQDALSETYSCTDLIPTTSMDGLWFRE